MAPGLPDQRRLLEDARLVIQYGDGLPGCLRRHLGQFVLRPERHAQHPRQHGNAAVGVTGVSDYTFGVFISSLQGGTTAHLTNNMVGAAGGQFARGIALWNLPTTTTTTVTGGRSASAKGISLHYNDPDFSAAGASSAVNLDGVSISATDIGILVEADGAGSYNVQMQVSGALPPPVTLRASWPTARPPPSRPRAARSPVPPRAS